jgi:ethanolamine utilization cobalamin adenosyltransferase
MVDKRGVSPWSYPSNMTMAVGKGALLVAPSKRSLFESKRISAAFITESCHHRLSDLTGNRQTTHSAW